MIYINCGIRKKFGKPHQSSQFTRRSYEKSVTFIYFCNQKLLKECKSLEMSVG